VMTLGPLPWARVPKSRFLVPETDNDGAMTVIAVMLAALF